MKIRITLPGPDEDAEIEYPDTTNISLTELIKIEDGVCKEIYLKNILEHVEKPYILIEQCRQKLRKGGLIYIESLDFVELSRGYYLGIVSNDDINSKINNTKYLHSIHDAIQWIKGEFVINTKNVDNYIYYLEGVKQ